MFSPVFCHLVECCKSVHLFNSRPLYKVEKLDDIAVIHIRNSHLYNIFEECLGCLVVLEIVIVTLLQERNRHNDQKGAGWKSF